LWSNNVPAAVGGARLRATILFVSAEHYFTPEPTAPQRTQTVAFHAGGREYVLAASAGVFSAQRLDPGTAVLLHKAPLPGPRGGVYLDLGCGYGPISMVLAGTSDHARVYAVDVNVRALELVQANAASLDLADRVTACGPDEVPPDVRFDEIWSNPPIRVGKAELHALLGRWLPRLAPDGTAWLVVARNLGADSLQDWLTTEGWQVSRHASQKGYRVFSVMREVSER
jgi:16S rRNA G1207 methylase RsmC